MDGTIVDTEPYWIAAEHALVEAHGGSWSHQQAMQLVGQSLTFSAGLLQEAGVRMEIREIIDSLTATVIRSVQRQVLVIGLGAFHCLTQQIPVPMRITS